MKRPIRIPPVVTVALVIGIVYVVLYPVFAPSRIGHHRSAQLLLKQMSIGLLIYISDFDDRFPPDMSSARAAYKFMAPYIKDESILTGVNKSSPEFLANGSLGGKKCKVEMASVVLFFESAPDEGKRATSFVDSTALVLDEKEFQEAVSNNWTWSKKPPSKAPEGWLQSIPVDSQPKAN